MKHRLPSNSKGFTLIELLVVVLITAMLSSLAIVYSHAGQDEVSVSIEASKISQLILEAKELSVSTYNANATTCAYGVHFDYTDQSYSLFAYNSAASVNGSTQLFCPTYASTTANGVITSDMAPYAGGATWQVKISPGVIMESSSPSNDVLTDVLFFPPDPLTLMSRDDTTFVNNSPTSNVYLTTPNGQDTETISVSPAGQVGY